MKKSPAKAHQIPQILMARPLLMKERREWFQRFRNGDFDIEDRHGGRREKIFKDA